MNNYIQSVYTLVAPTPQQIYPVNTDNLNGGRYFNSWLKYGAPVSFDEVILVNKVRNYFLDSDLFKYAT